MREALIAPETGKGELAHVWPELLPASETVLFTIWPGGDYADARIGALSLDTGEMRVLIEGGTGAHFAPTGHLVYARSGTLMAAPFDPGRLEMTGPAVPVLEGVLTNSRTGAAQYTLSADGTLAYVVGRGDVGLQTLVWVDLKGQEQPLSSVRHQYLWPRLSPDGTLLALNVREPDPDIWVHDFRRGTLTRLTFAPGEDETPVWSPDGTRLAFSSNGRKQGFAIAVRSGAEEEPLMTRSRHFHFSSWSPDGKFLLFEELDDSGSGMDLWLLPLEGERAPRPFLQTQFNEHTAVFSPDGRWVAYASDESGRAEVYVRGFPGPGEKIQISNDGGSAPRWSATGRELFYARSGAMMAVTVSLQPSFQASPPRLLFRSPHPEPFVWRMYDVAPDSRRLVMLKDVEEVTVSAQIHIVLNWFEDLKRRVPAGRN